MEDGRPVETSSKYLKARCVFERLLACLGLFARCPGISLLTRLLALCRQYGVRILREDDLFALVAAPPAGAAAPSTRKRKRRRRSAAETSPLQEAAVRAVGGYPLSLFPESVVGRTKVQILAEV